MNGLLDSGRAIVADLIRKRLWPIAVVLLLALVAVPVLVTSSSSPGVSAPADVAAAAAPGTAAAAAEPTATAAPERAGHVRDPFFDPPAPASDTAPTPATTATTAAPPAQSAATKQTGATPATTARAKAKSPAKASPSKARRTAHRPAATPPATRPATGTYYRTAARLGARSTTRPLQRLTPIGDRANPAALYLGVMKVGRPYAVFVLGHRTTSSGDATCAAETGCAIIGLTPGDTQILTLHSAGGRVMRRFAVHVASVGSIRTGAGAARAMRAAVHPHGRAALRAMSRSAGVAGALGRLGYRRGSGLLYSIAAAQSLEKATR